MPRAIVIQLHPAAPPKPSEGAACNGCGVCCAAEPCPLGMLLSRQRWGRCKALDWDDGAGRYACGALAQPATWLPWLPQGLARRLVRRWIAAAKGCDASLALA